MFGLVGIKIDKEKKLGKKRKKWPFGLLSEFVLSVTTCVSTTNLFVIFFLSTFSSPIFF